MNERPIDDPMMVALRSVASARPEGPGSPKKNLGPYCA